MDVNSENKGEVLYFSEIETFKAIKLCINYFDEHGLQFQSANYHAM